MKVPQADDFGEVLQLSIAIGEGVTDIDALSKKTQLKPRQALYFVEAAEILGFVSREKKKIFLTPEGHSFVVSDNKKLLAFEALKRIPVFQEIMKEACNSEGVVTRTQITNIIRTKADLSVVTASRRTSSILNWFYWASYHFPNFCCCEDEQVRIYC